MPLPIMRLFSSRMERSICSFEISETRIRSICAPNAMISERTGRTVRSKPTRPEPKVRAQATAGSAMEETDFHQQEEDRWIKDAAEELKKRALRNDFDALAIIARPRRSACSAKASQGSREADRLHGEQGNERATDPGH